MTRKRLWPYVTKNHQTHYLCATGMFQDQGISRRGRNDEAIFHRTNQPSDSSTRFMIKGLGNKSFINLISIRESNEWMHGLVVEYMSQKWCHKATSVKKNNAIER